MVHITSSHDHPTLLFPFATVKVGTVECKDEFVVQLDDFLMGLCSLSGELARFCVNCVVAGDYGRPKRISTFLTELNAGFRLLNLKNDGLRKRYDSLKYDLKKIEEVVYDLSIRGLKEEEKAQEKEE